MERLTFIAVLTLLYLQSSNGATPIHKDTDKGKEFVFSYNGVVEARNYALEKLLSQWNITAKLIMQPEGNTIVMKFDDIKTSLFTGDFDNAQSAKMIPIPKEAHHLALPFIVHYYKNGSVSALSHQPDDPLWSLNMKRAIASIIQLDTEHLEHLNGTAHFEESIYGNCEAEYIVTEDDHNSSALTVSKKLNDTSCAYRLANKWSNMIRPSTSSYYFWPAKTNVEREYRIKLVETDSSVGEISFKSQAAITFQTMENEASLLELVQRQYFELSSKHDIVTPIDVTKNTKSTSLVYVFDENDESSGRQPKKVVDQGKLIEDLKNYYDEFKADLQKSPLVPGDIGINNTLLSIVTTLHQMDEDAIDLTALLVFLSEDAEMKNIFVSVLPYIGSNETVALIELALENQGLNDLSLIKLLATFPIYVDEYTPELFKKMEVMLSLKTQSKQVKNAAILSFANMVAAATVQSGKREKYLQEYADKFLAHYRQATDHEDKMVYLLCLNNLISLMDKDVLISIIESKDESHYIRTLAAYTFKPFLALNEEKFQLFKRLWTIVSNTDEHFEVRVAALDILMTSNLSKTQFDTIIKHFEKSSNDPFQKHLQNYLSTTLASLQNTTMYNDYLGEFASDSVHIPSYYEAWTTGNYRIAYTDTEPNFGRYFQASLIANPITNGINVMQLSYNKFAMAMDLGTYTLYLRLDGVADFIFANILKTRDISEEAIIPELFEILMKSNYKPLEKYKIHIEVVLYSDSTAVFGMQLNPDNIEAFRKNPMLLELVELLDNYESVTFPKLYFSTLRSDLGTHVKIQLTETDVVSHKLVTNSNELSNTSVKVKTGEIKYRTSNYEILSLESYNPLADVSISAYKYKSRAQQLDIPVSANLTGEYFTFENHDDMYNLVIGRSIGMTVDDADKLKESCPSCKANVESPLKEPTLKLMKLEEIALTLNHTYATGDSIRVYRPDPTEVYQRNSLGIAVAEPVLMMFYVLDAFEYLGPDVLSVSVRSKSYLKDPIHYKVEFTLDIDDIFEDNDPINGTRLSAGVKITSRIDTYPDDICTLSATYNYSSGPILNTKDTGSHVEQKHTIRADYSDYHTVYMVCFDRDFQYPSRRPDKLSISPVDPAKGKGRFSLGPSDKSYACSNKYSFTFSDIYEPSVKQMETIKSLDAYQTCKKDATGLKYIPPTEACLAVHNAISKYNSYKLYVDFKNMGGELRKIAEKLQTSDRGIKLLEYEYINRDVAHVQLNKEFGNILKDDIDQLLDFNTSLGVFSGSEDPTSIAYDDDDVIFGISSICHVMPNRINTFTGKDIDHYYQTEVGKDIVAYIECFNYSRNGLTVQKYSDKKVGFTMWSGNDKLITSVPEGKMKVELNGEELHKQFIGDKLKIYFLADDVLYVANGDFQVYYNTEYFSIKALSLMNNYICGLCAYDRKP